MQGWTGHWTTTGLLLVSSVVTETNGNAIQRWGRGVSVRGVEGTESCSALQRLVTEKEPKQTDLRKQKIRIEMVEKSSGDLL